MRRGGPGFGSSEPDPSSSGSIATVIVGRILHGGRLEPAEIGVDDRGRIVRVAKALRGDRRVDYGQAVILPAATDLHVHFREPGPPDSADNFETGSLQAAFGGVGTVGDMPNTTPPTDTPEAIRDKIGRTRRRLAVDLVVYAAARDLGALPALANEAGGFKLYLAPTTGADAGPRGPALRMLLEAVAATGLPLAVHAEDPDRFRASGPPRSTADWDAQRPVAAEAAAVASLLPAPENLRLHVAHVTDAAVAEQLRRAGHSFEATPHHLLLSTKRAPGATGKVNPPLRSERERDALWGRFASGEVPCVASDHAPHSLAEKERAFDLAPSGMPGVETTLPLLLAMVRSGDLPLDTLVAAACDRPARWLGLPTGRVSPYHRAHLIVVDFRQRTKLAAERLHAPCHWTAFEGWEAIFPLVHLHDGEPIVQDGQFVGNRQGTVVRPEYAPTPPARGPLRVGS